MARKRIYHLQKEVVVAEVATGEEDLSQFILQKIQPALLGFRDGSISTLAPLFAAAGLTSHPIQAFYVGLAASVGAGISMGLAEALSDDGKLTGRDTPIMQKLDWEYK